MKSSEYIENERKIYSLYVMQSRSLPSVCDGLKAAGRRALWTARSGDKFKTATLAGATMPIHPHASCDSSINTLAAPYGNNIPLFKGYGSFGTMLDPTAYGASRYTSIATSKFTNDVVFRDIEIIPMTSNYDDTLLEPVHFLPLVPTVLLNPTEGIAIGFATNILPRSLTDIINIQLNCLKSKKTTNNLIPTFTPTNTSAVSMEGRIAIFEGDFEEIDSNHVRITKIPYGQTHEKVLAQLDKLCDAGIIDDYDDWSRDIINIEVLFKRGVLKTLSRSDLIKQLGLSSKQNENLNVLDFSGQGVWSADPIDLVMKFTNWRLQFFIQRYEREKQIIDHDLQRYYDIRTAIKNNVGSMAKKTKSRALLREYLTTIKIINTDYIADLPIYRFTEEEFEKNETRIKEGESQLSLVNELLGSEQKRKDVYANELREILNKYNKGVYSTQ